ncbi:MAG: hypothetical protein KKD48_04430 [Nanoarchaeota archaeon]|nr:hypothetical protein [Nanoarchaeota archaeon]
MGLRSIIRDILVIYLAYRLMKIWLLNDKFTFSLGILTIILVIITFWFLAEKVI